MPTGPHANNLFVFESGTQSFQLHYCSNTSSLVFLSISLAYTTVFTAKQNKFRNSHIFILIINYIVFQEPHLKYHWKSFSHLSKAPVNLFLFYVVLIIYSLFSTWNKPWLVTRWQTWHIQIPETCLFFFIGLLRVWLFSWYCTCELHLSANASASLPELVTGRISKIRHLQMLGYQKWILVLYFWGFHLMKDCGTWQGGGSQDAPTR